MQRVLVIEDESVLRSNVARGIAKLGVEVFEAGSLNDALRVVDHKHPDLIVSDIDMPERSGLELLGELGRRALKVPVIFVSGYLNAYRAQIPHHAAVEVLEKPVPIEELREVVMRRLGAPPTTDAAPFSVPDYLQLACLGRHSVQVDVDRDGSHAGEIIVANGEIWRAADALGGGLPALGRLAFGGSGTVRCRRFADAPPERNLQGGWEFLLMEAARVMDENKRKDELSLDLDWDTNAPPSFGEHESRPAASESRPVATSPAAEVENGEAIAFQSAWERGVDALLAKNYRAALAAFVLAGELRPEDPKVRANLKRLAELGYALESSESSGG